MASYNPQPFVSNPYSSFDPSQYTDPYSLFSGKALPWPSQYAGTPTDAYGNPIQSYVNANNAAQAQYQQQLAAYQQQLAAAQQQQPAAQPAASGTSGTSGTPGTTLNSSPGSQASPYLMSPAAAAAPPGNIWSSGGQQQIGPAAALQAAMGTQAPGMPNRAQIMSQIAGNADIQAGLGDQQNGVSGSGGRFGGGGPNNGLGAAMGYLAQQNYANAVNPQQAAAPAAAAPTAPTPPDMSQAYLQALANPGPLKQVGANVPLSATTTQPSSGVLQNFLANWQPQGGSGPGAGFTQAFSKALRG